MRRHDWLRENHDGALRDRSRSNLLQEANRAGAGARGALDARWRLVRYLISSVVSFLRRVPCGGHGRLLRPRTEELYRIRRFECRLSAKKAVKPAGGMRGRRGEPFVPHPPRPSLLGTDYYHHSLSWAVRAPPSHGKHTTAPDMPQSGAARVLHDRE